MGKYTMTRTSSRARSWRAPDYDSYEDMLKYSSIPIVGSFYKQRADYLEYKENLRYWEDLSRNMGFDLEDISYPIRSGLYRGYRSGFESVVSATESVIGLYGGANLMRWL